MSVIKREKCDSEYLFWEKLLMLRFKGFKFFISRYLNSGKTQIDAVLDLFKGSNYTF
jgi:hypothetical protein